MAAALLNSPPILELYYGAHQAFRSIVPHPDQRIPISFSNAIYPIALYGPFIFMAYLSRRPHTYLIRLLLLPTTITAILVAAYRFTWVIPELNVYNWGQALLAGVTIAKALEYAFTKEGMLKIGESRPGVVKGKEKTTAEPPHANGHAPDHDQPDVHRNTYVAEWLSDAVELACTMRGLRWKFGRGIHIPKDPRPLQRGPFLRATLLSFIRNFLLLDFLESIIKIFPGVGTPLGGSIFYPSLSLPARFAISTLIHIITGSAILSGFRMVYDLITLIAVAVFHTPTTSWPPVMDRPWAADSMHSFWATHWHQLFRQTFLVFGGYPGKWIAGKYGMLFGVFLASGLYHECAMYAMGRGWDFVVVWFFAAQGPILVLEVMWKRVTGRKVGGQLGNLWVYFVMLVLAQPMVNSWHRRGLGGGMVIPPFVSPFRIFITPFIQRYLHSI